MLVKAAATLASLATHAQLKVDRVAKGHYGEWNSTPKFTPTCVNGAFPDTEQDPARTFCCSLQNPKDPKVVCDAKFQHGNPDTKSLPPYTSDDRRDHHHVIDGPVIGNGNVGVAVGSGNVWNQTAVPWIDLFTSTNSFWAITGANHTTGEPFRGRLALPGTMALGVTRISLPESFAGASYHAIQDLDTATVHVNLTSGAGLGVSFSLFVSPLAPVVWTTIRTFGVLPREMAAGGLAVSINTTVLGHFYHREPSMNTSFAVNTTASCFPKSPGQSSVTRASDFAGSGVGVVGAIHHSIRSGAAAPASAPSCEVDGQTSSSLSFGVIAGQPLTLATVVRTSRDPACVARPSPESQPLCDLSSDPAAAASAIARDLDASALTLADAEADHASHWRSFWNKSSISLPDASETEAFWYGAQYVLNSAIPHEGQEQTPPGLYGPWGTVDNPGWHGDYTIDYNYEAIFYGVMAANHPELMLSYPNPMLDFIPRAEKYAAAKSQLALNRTCPGHHFPDVLAPWGYQEGADGVNEDAGLMSNGPYAAMPIVWAWEYGDRSNLTQVLERWFPLIKGEADFFACWLQMNATTGELHDLHDCTNESPALCTSMDTVLTLSMMRRSLATATDMAVVLGEPVDPKWAYALAHTTSDPLGWMHIADVGSAMGNTSHMCTWCASKPGDKSRTPTVGDCQQPANGNGALNRAQCAMSNSTFDAATNTTVKTCPPGYGFCSQQAYGSCRKADGHSNLPSGGNSQSIFPCFPGDYIGTNSSALAAAGASTVTMAHSWQQGNSFTKIFSAAARVVAPGLLTAQEVYSQWLTTLKSTQQPNFIPFNPYSGFETVGATEYVQYMLLQSDPSDGGFGGGGFLGFFEALPPKMDASFEKLRGRGGFVVSSSITKGKVGTTTILSGRGTKCVIRRPQSWPKSTLQVEAAGSKIPVMWIDNGSEFFSFETQTGVAYVLGASS